MMQKKLPIEKELSALLEKYNYLLEMGMSFASEKDLNHLLDLALSRSRDITNSSGGAIFLVETIKKNGDAKKVIRFKLAQNDEIKDIPENTSEFILPFDNKSIAGYVAVSGNTLSIPDVYLINGDEPYYFDLSIDKKTGYKTRSLLAVPIKNHKEEVIGVLEFINRIDRRSSAYSNRLPEDKGFLPAMPYFNQDVALAVWAAGLVGVALENVYLINTLKNQNARLDKIVKERTGELNKSMNELELKNRKMEDDLNIAHKMQTGIVPHKEKIESLSRISMLKISSVFKPCNKLGGDFWDIVELDNNLTGIIVVDFAGHGIAPSLNTFRFKELIHSIDPGIHSPALFMEMMNNNIFDNYNMHATCFYAIFNREEKKLAYCRAGHPYGIWHNKKKESLIDLNSKGMALGFMPDSKYEEKEIALDVGDKVFFYTDGIVEAMNKDNELFGEERLKNWILTHKSSSEADASASIIGHITKFTGQDDLQDDITMVSMELM